MIDNFERILVMEELDGENLAFYDTLHKGDSITIDTNMEDASGSYTIVRKYRHKNKVRFVLRENEGE